MTRIIIPILVAFAVFIQNFPKDSYAQELPSKNFLKSFDWKSSGPINQFSKNWVDFTGDQSGENGFKDKKILKKTTLNIDGISYEGSIRRFHKTDRYEAIFHAKNNRDLKATQKNLGYCGRLIKSFTTALGTPKNLVDQSDSNLSNDYAKIDFDAFWDINKSRLRLSCFALKVFRGFIPLIFITYGHQDNVTEVFDLIFLKCSKRKRGIGTFADGETLEEPPFTITINPNGNKLQSKKMKIGKTTSFNDREIVSSFENKKDKIKGIFVLDRYAGSYIWTLKLTEKKQTIAAGSGYKFWGDCTKIVRGKKF